MRVIEQQLLNAIYLWRKWRSGNTKFEPNADPRFGIVYLFDQAIAYIDKETRKPLWGSMACWDTATTKSRLKALDILDKVKALNGADYNPRYTFVNGTQLSLDLDVPVQVTQTSTPRPQSSYTPFQYEPAPPSIVDRIQLGNPRLTAAERDIVFVPTRGPLTDEEARQILQNVVNDTRDALSNEMITRETQERLLAATQAAYEGMTNQRGSPRHNVVVRQGEHPDTLVVDLEIMPTRTRYRTLEDGEEEYPSDPDQYRYNMTDIADNN